MPIGTDEQRAWLTLLRTPGVGSAAIRTLVEHAGGAQQAVAQASRTQMSGVRLDHAAQRWLKAPDAAVLEADLAWLQAPDHHLLLYPDIDFPPLLADIAQPPAALFVHGDPRILLRPQLAVVGARSATQAGIDNARAFAGTLAATGLVIISGLADGIDAAAHEAALAAGTPTVAVMGTGPDRIYPRKHQHLAGRIAAHGTLVSEFPPGTQARAQHFPQRNRIISGLALGTLVIEAGLRSGSLITARLAGEQGREIFALPGSIHNPLARGCHRLIRDGARLVETAGEIHEALAPLARALGDSLTRRLAETAEASPEASGATSTSAAALDPGTHADPDYRRLMDAMGYDPASLDTLVERSGLPAAAVSSMLLMLELEGVVISQPGGRFMRRS